MITKESTITDELVEIVLKEYDREMKIPERRYSIPCRIFGTTFRDCYVCLQEHEHSDFPTLIFFRSERRYDEFFGDLHTGIAFGPKSVDEFKLILSRHRHWF